MNGARPLGPASPKSFHAYPRGGDYDLESGSFRRIRKPKRSLPDDLLKMLKSLIHNLRHVYHLHPLAALLASLCFGLAVLVLLSLYESRLRALGLRAAYGPGRTRGLYPLSGLRSLVMVAGHSVYTSSSCGDAEREDSWVLEPYQRHAGQAATFVEHIRDGVEIAAGDEGALLLFSGGETRRGAGPRSEAQSYWEVAEAKGWFGKRDSVRNRALTEEHARDSFENLLFSVCRFRELSGTYPQNITVVSYDFKKERFAHLHRLAIGFPEGKFFYFGTPATPDSEEAAKKGEASVRAQFQEDPYGCSNPLHLKRLKRDPFHRSIPYPDGCPELRGLFSYCGPVPYPGTLPW